MGGGALPVVPEVASPVIETDLERVIRYAEAGDVAGAMTIMRKGRLDEPMRNALGVCNLRLGRGDEAVRLFRELVLKAGCTWTRPNTPNLYKINYATSLLMTGHPAGCHEMLGDVGDESHPSVARLRKTIKKWEAGLSFRQRWLWRLFRLDPRNQPVTFDFLPGEFVDPTDVLAEPALGRGLVRS